MTFKFLVPLWNKHVAFLGCMFVLLSGIGCKDDGKESSNGQYNQAGVLISKSPIWQQDVTGKGTVTTAVSPAYYKDVVIVGGTDNAENDILLALNIHDGSEQWSWSEFDLPGERVYDINNGEYGVNQKDSLWILQYDEHLYALDLSTGATLWTDVRDGYYGVLGVQIVGEHYYTTFDLFEGDQSVPTLIKGEIGSTVHDSIYSPPISKIANYNGSYGSMNEPLIYEIDGEVHAFLTFIEFIDLEDYKEIHYMSSVNLTTGEMDFEKTQLGDTSAMPFSQRPVLVGDVVVVNANGKMHGINRSNGEVIWTYSPFESPFDGHLAYAEYKGNIYGVNDAGDLLVVSLNASTGEVNWENRTVGGTDQV